MTVANDLMNQVKRERETEAKVRKMDASELVAHIHALEDRITELEGEVEWRDDALKDCGYVSPL